MSPVHFKLLHTWFDRVDCKDRLFVINNVDRTTQECLKENYLNKIKTSELTLFPAWTQLYLCHHQRCHRFLDKLLIDHTIDSIISALSSSQNVFYNSSQLGELKNCNNFADIALNVHRKSVNCSLSWCFLKIFNRTSKLCPKISKKFLLFSPQ